MGSPERGSKSRALLAFGISAFFTWSTAVGVTWLAQRGLRSDAPRGRVSRLATSHHAKEPEEISRSLREELLSGQECATAVAGLSSAALRELLSSFDPPFWRTSPNAAIFLRQAALSLGRQAPAQVVLSELTSLFRQRELDGAATRRLTTVAFAGILEARKVTREELAELLRGMPEPNALSLLEVWMDFQEPRSPQSDLDTALQIAAQFSPQLDDRLKDEIATMVVRVWGHRAPPLADALLFTTKFEHTRVHNRLLAEGAGMLAIANPEELQRRMIQFAPVMAPEAGAIAANAGLPVTQAFALAKQMQPKNADAFLRNYVNGFCAGYPGELSKIAETHPAKELPESVAGLVASGLITGGDRGRMESWTEGLSVAAQAKLWDSIASSPVPLDVSAAHYYLQKRPREVPPSMWAMEAVLGALPYEEAMDALPLAGELNGQFRTQLSRKQLTKLLAEDPDQVPDFLATIPPEVRRAAMERVLGEWTDPDPQMFQSWIQQTNDPSLRAELQSRVLENEAMCGNTGDAKTRLIQLATSGSDTTPYRKIVERIMAAETNSRSASSFIQQLPPGEIRDQATLAFAKKWSGLDPVAASEWLASVPAGHGRDLATRELISAARDDPERALANAAGIQDSALRFSAARSVLRVWRDSDPARAETFIRSAGFSPEETSTLQAILGAGSMEGGR